VIKLVNTLPNNLKTVTLCRIAQLVQWPGYRLHGSGIESRQGQRIFYFLLNVRTCSGVRQPPVRLVPVLFPRGVGEAGREVHHIPPPRAKLKNAWSYTSALYMFSLRHRDNIVFNWLSINVGEVTEEIVQMSRYWKTQNKFSYKTKG